MTKRLKIFLFIIVVGLILTACASNNSSGQLTATTSAPQAGNTATPVGYPANSSGDQAQTTPTGYPAPIDQAPTGYPAPTDVMPPVGNTGVYPAPGTFQLTLADGSVKTMAVDTLNTLPKEKVSFDGTELEVLSLANALKQYGVESYNQISATGAQGAALTMNKDQIAQAYLDIHADGTVRLVVQGQPQNTWVAELFSLTIN